MPRGSELRTNFIAGELSRNVEARTDFARYFNGSKTLENFVVRPQGSIFRRKGTRFLGETKDSTKLSRLLEFQFSILQTYVLEVGQGYIRFFSDQARVVDNPVTINNATQANPVVITTASPHNYSNGDVVIIDNVEGMEELNGCEHAISNITASTFELIGVDGTGFDAYIGGGTSSRVHEISSPYSENELFDIKVVQDSDIMYLIHPLHPIQKLIRLAANQFTLEEVDLVKGPYIDENIVSTDIVTLTGGAPWTEGSTLTLTASGGHTPFTAGHVGGLWQLRSGTDIGHVKITGFTSSTIVTVEAKNNIPASLQGVGVFTWSEGEFSNARGFPAAVSFHEQRLVLAGSISAPQRVWFSNSNGDYENFEAGTEADDPFLIKIASQRGDPIRWLFSDNVLFIGTAGGIFRVRNSNNSAALSSTDIDVKKHISHGTDLIQPESVGDLPLYIQRAGKKVRSIEFSVSQDKYRARDVTIDADEITGDSIIEINGQENPISSLWTIRQDGQIAILTIELDQQISAWGRYLTQGKFESKAIISDSGGDDIVYFVVNRTINGVIKRYVESHKPNYLNDNIEGFYVDSGLTYNGIQNATLTLSSASGSFAIETENTGEIIITESGESIITEEEPLSVTVDADIFDPDDVGKEIHELGEGTGRAVIIEVVDGMNAVLDTLEDFSTTILLPGTWAIAIKNIVGLDHLIGETVSINSDGATEPNQVVDSNGAVSISFAGSVINVGLEYSSIQESMPIEASSLSGVIGSSQGKEKRIDTIVVNLQETRGAKILLSGKSSPVPFRSVDDNMNRGLNLFSGNREVTVAGGWDKDVSLGVTQSEPQPLTIKSITYKVTVNDK
jgi:hypothetical protein